VTQTIVEQGTRRRARPSTARVNVVDIDREWSLRALCRNDFRFSDGPFGVKSDPTVFARQLAHRCRAHCPVVEQCAAETMAHSRPRKAIRAGVYFPDGGRPRVLDDNGCGPQCAGLPAVHRSAQ
jgi:hypothetical protein